MCPTPSKSPYPCHLEAGETLTVEVGYNLDDRIEPFGFAVSNQAVHVLLKDAGLHLEPQFHMERLPAATVRRVWLEPVSALGRRFKGTLLLVAGALTLLWGWDEFVERGDWRVLGSAALLGGLGVFMFRHNRERHAIVIETARETLTLTPPVPLIAPDVAELHAYQEAFVAACAAIGIATGKPA